jgi:hypothetical protein
MVDSIDDITRQARQGSVAAIIQVLNDQLAESGIRARAVLAHGVLQLLCEAAHIDNLDRQRLVNRIRTILESIQPRQIRRVKINSRIVREQQLLWLEEINRDPENQLLWSEEITLSKSNSVRRLLDDWQLSRVESSKAALMKSVSARLDRHGKRQFVMGTIGGACLSAALVLMGWVVYERLDIGLGETSQAQMNYETENEPSLGATESDVSVSLLDNSQSSSTPAEPTTTPDPFVQAVRIAEKAAVDGQVAESSADWLDLASRWQRASDLMAEVSAEDHRFVTAQDRQALYKENSEAALREAEQLRSLANETTSPEHESGD